MKRVFGRNEKPDLAVEKILDSAEKAFVELGVSAAGMSEIAEFAGCSRGTLYRYFENRHALHLAYVRRTALRIQQRVFEAVADIEDPQERLVETILRAVREVRQNPATAAWFSSSGAGLATRMSRSTEVAGVLTSTFAAELPGGADGKDDARLRHRWIVRVIVSLLSDPGGDETEERMLIERFVVPVVMNDGSDSGVRGRKRNG